MMLPPNVSKALGLLLRSVIFLILIGLTAGCVFLAGRYVVYELLQIASDDFSRPAMAFEFIVITLMAIILFRVIVLRRQAKAQIIGLGFYLSCIMIAIFFVNINQVELAPVFEWLGLVGMAAHFLIMPFKKEGTMA